MIEPRPAGFWIRALALVIDVAVFVIVRASYTALARRLLGAGAGDAWTLGPTLGSFTLLFAAVYTIVLTATFGQTIGKMVAGVRVLAGDAPPPLGASLLRFCAYFASVASLGLGFLMAGLRRDKRALHDLIAGTRVERVREAPEPAAPSPAPAPPAPPTGAG